MSYNFDARQMTPYSMFAVIISCPTSKYVQVGYALHYVDAGLSQPVVIHYRGVAQ